ncbi:hypothetical protein COOONC_16124 [Cooperia oncophora]
MLSNCPRSENNPMSKLKERPAPEWMATVGHTPLNLSKHQRSMGPGKCQRMRSKMFAQEVSCGNTSLEDEPHRASHLTQTPKSIYWKASIRADPDKATRDIAKQLDVDHATVSRHLKQIGKSRKPDK